MLPQRHRLRSSREISGVRREGQRWHHPLLVLFTRQGEQPDSRFAVSVSRRVGNAVVRNRCKRRLREALRRHLPELAPGWDCLLVARNELANASFEEVDAAVSQLLQRAGLRGPGLRGPGL